jgi:FAD/FMN-containing dehydrogenase
LSFIDGRCTSVHRVRTLCVPRRMFIDESAVCPCRAVRRALIDLQQFKGMPYRHYFAAGEAIFRRYAGRPHWGKLHTRSADELGPLYPGWDDLQAVRRRWDPAGVFMNHHLRRLLG